MILLTLSRGNEHERVHLRLPASPAEIGEAFVILDGISLDTTTTAILDVRGNVPGLYRYLYDVDVEDSEQFQKLQQLAERTDALSPEKAAIFSGALDAEHAENLDEALAVANRLDEYMLIGNITSDSELGAYLVDKGITPFPDRFKPYINYARVGAEYREKHDGVYANGSYLHPRQHHVRRLRGTVGNQHHPHRGTGSGGGEMSREKLIYIASPFAGEIEANIAFAKKACRYAIRQGHTPIAVHLLYPQMLDDSDPAERETGLRLGHRVLEVCDELWCCGDRISSGMAREIEEAQRLGIPIRQIGELEIKQEALPAEMEQSEAPGQSMGMA